MHLSNSHTSVVGILLQKKGLSLTFDWMPGTGGRLGSMKVPGGGGGGGIPTGGGGGGGGIASERVLSLGSKIENRNTSVRLTLAIIYNPGQTYLGQQRINSHAPRYG